MLLSVFSGIPLPLRAFGAAAGDVIEYGAYPQSRVTDEALISALDDAPKTWTSYNYMTGTGHEDDGLMEASDYMKFADFFFNGAKYRAVTFTEYRPRWLYWKASATR